MSVLTTTQATVEIRRDRLVGLIAAVAVLAAAVTWALSTYAVSSSSGKAQPATQPTNAVAQHVVTSAKQESVIMSMTPAALQAGALGGYALPTVQGGPTLEEVLASMSPATRRYTEQIMALTIAQLQAGAAGSP